MEEGEFGCSSYDDDDKMDKYEGDKAKYPYPDKKKDNREKDRDRDDKNRYPMSDRNKPNTQTHVHEFAGSTTLDGSIIHNHRFAGVTSEAIPCGDSHVHAILVNTDFFFNHYHEVGVRTGPAIYIEGEKHIHYVEGETTLNFGHDHDFAFTTFIENPLQV